LEVLWRETNHTNAPFKAGVIGLITVVTVGGQRWERPFPLPDSSATE
jgi:hypothetical protein